MLKQEDNGVVVNLKVIPNSQKFEIKDVNPWRKKLRISVSSSPEDGKANQELLDGLETVLGSKVDIVSGVKSREKQIVVRDVPIDEVIEKLGLRDFISDF
ncbi:hypothetical protein AKJ40_00165 [candidate division MSBL1 archaeon SCGC-AAA259M10]|uniref:UPF0235 protein AKJ40_00165 n=3 Tax=candidate division MSBL1 TaxID=215777 RepID=A0A133V393_9EURY|nr:hypothetical protein AKJ66_00230 [candidate division MSBL1 archaeon SCGC-AAA259E22]KXA95440.1 hypothetical protein AKJ36_00565 [candidate division MSBL1 archaeon SCGC-AAA259I07]KXB00900.1 hypothetical protein AKJ40_00165 [candidate division MSBL1 archaeon SCGC-AAA259M10]